MIEETVRTSKSGRPTLTEHGGGWTNTGQAQIIARPDGERPRAIYMPRRGSLACASHAVIPIEPGYFVIRANHHRGDFEVEILKVTSISRETAQLDRVSRFSHSEFEFGADADVPEALTEALAAAKAKATCYHCREPHYAEE